MNSYCGHGREIGAKEEEKEVFDEVEKDEITQIVGAHEDENFVIHEEISHVVERESKIIDEIKKCD